MLLKYYTRALRSVSAFRHYELLSRVMRFVLKKSNIRVIAVSSRVSQSLFINVCLSAGLYDMLSVSPLAGSGVAAYIPVPYAFPFCVFVEESGCATALKW